MSDRGGTAATSEADRQHSLQMTVAGIVKDILSARLQVDSDNVSSETRAAWWTSPSLPATSSPDYLLTAAAYRLAEFQQHHFGSEFSVGPDDTDDPNDPDFQEQRIGELIVGFAEPDRLRAAASALRSGGSIEWSSLADWDCLPELREFLNRFALSLQDSPKEVASHPKIKVEPPGTLYYSGAAYPGLTLQQMKMLETLLSEPKYHVQKSYFIDAVWGDRENPEDAAVRASISRLNKFLGSTPVPIKVDSKNGYIMLIVDE